MYKNKNAFTLVELMVVIVIMGILIAVALPKFQEAVVRARYANLKYNMGLIRTTVATYSATWGGITPRNRTELFTEATNKKFWRFFKNPFNSKIDLVEDLSILSAAIHPASYGNVIFGGSLSVPGNACCTTPNMGDFVVYGIDRVGAPYQTKNGIFYYSYTFTNN